MGVSDAVLREVGGKVEGEVGGYAEDFADCAGGVEEGEEVGCYGEVPGPEGFGEEGVVGFGEGDEVGELGGCYCD